MPTQRKIMQTIKKHAIHFVLTVATTTAGESMAIPCQNFGVFNATIDWGDGSTSTVTAYNDAGLSHVYALAGTYTIRISGVFPNVYFLGNKTMAAKVKTVESLGVMGWTNLINSFRSCVNMTSFNGDGDTSNVTNMYGMFAYDSSASVIDVSGFDTSSVTNMGSMFYSCSSASDLAINLWDISNVGILTYFVGAATLSTIRYDATLIAWATLTVQPSLAPNFGNSTYTLGGAAEAARSSLITNDLWTITDGGGV